MATRTGARKSVGSGAAGAGACPAAAWAATAASRSATALPSAPPTTSAPRRGALRGAAKAWAPAGAAGEPPTDAVTPLVLSAAGTDAPAKLLRPLAGNRPGTCSSRTAWKLVPPKPNADTPARRMPPTGLAHSRSSVLTLNGDEAQSRLGLGTLKFRLGGSTFSCSDMTALNRPAVPAAALRWPMLDLTEPRAMEPASAPALPKTSPIAESSATSPTRVDVPCASISPTVAGSTLALAQARWTAIRWPTGLGAVMPLPLPSLEPAIPVITA